LRRRALLLVVVVSTYFTCVLVVYSKWLEIATADHGSIPAAALSSATLDKSLAHICLHLQAV